MQGGGYDPNAGYYGGGGEGYYNSGGGTGDDAGMYNQQQQQAQDYYDPNQYYEGGDQAGYGMTDYYSDIGGGTGGQNAYGSSWDMNMPQSTQHSHQMPQHQQVETGSFYLHSEFSPQVFGFPVTAVALDSTYEVVYAASTTQAMSSTRFNSQRASMLVTHSISSSSGGNANQGDYGMLFSSIAGHVEASSEILQSVYEKIYGIPKTVPLAPSRQHIPPHAYRPPYGKHNVGMLGAGATEGHIGITNLLALPDGMVASVSPSGVRVHSHGGCQVMDQALDGMVAATIHPHAQRDMATHITVGGLPYGTRRKCEVFCIDLWANKIVSSRAFQENYDKASVTCMGTSHERGSVVAGCSDGAIRVLDGSLRELANIKSHAGGVASIAVSEDGNLVATAGYSSRIPKGKEASSLYAFPDPSIRVFDIRYLGRGGFPHPFAGSRGGPRFLEFLPDMEGIPANRLLVGSGQSGGGLQILTPFESQSESSPSFLIPQLSQGESMTSLTRTSEDLAIGTSMGRILHHKLHGYSNSATKPKKPLISPPYTPPIPAASLDPSILVGAGPRNGSTTKVKSVFSSYILQAEPKLSSIGTRVEDAETTFGTLGKTPIVPTSRRKVAQTLTKEASTDHIDFMTTIPASKLELDILSNHNTVSKRYKGKKAQDPLPNPNKFLYNGHLSSLCYEDGLNRRRRVRSNRNSDDDSGESIPQRYRLKARPDWKSRGTFDAADFNDTGLIPGWDYAPTMPNSFASSVLLLLYFFPEIRSPVLGAQYNDKLFSSTKAYERALSPELGFVFHQIESLATSGLVYPARPHSHSNARLGAWVPSNFLTALSAMPEAEQLQILDGSPAAVGLPRRPEAFYRFLAYQLDKELSKNSDLKVMDSINGIDFVSVNSFITGSSPPTHSSTRALTLELAYETFNRVEKKPHHFGEILQHALCRETRLRAWNQKSKAYETIIQRKIVTSLPKLLAISCSCAGRKEEDGLWAWRTDLEGRQFLPETIEIEFNADGNSIVRELVKNDEGREVWESFDGKGSLPKSVAELLPSMDTGVKHRYRLDAVLSFIRDENEVLLNDDEHPGHHVLHARIPIQETQRIVQKQMHAAENLASSKHDPEKLVLTAKTDPEEFRKRAEVADSLMKSKKDGGETAEWMLFNGFVVSKTVSEDARAFHISFKEPCLLVFRQISTDDEDNSVGVMSSESAPVISSDDIRLPKNVMNARSLSPNTLRPPRSFDFDAIQEGKLIAFDAEFVSVQEEESTLADDGSKVTLQDTRHALARISIVDCESGDVMLDDHVLPREPIVDYLTRFSGIVEEDLDPNKTTHNLISTRSAYLKLRYLISKGCIFVGHGLSQDFSTVNIAVPPNQIIDTVHLFHQPGMRFISLRFLANLVLGRDMQQDIHDSVEDAVAALELYQKALMWKKEGIFDKKLQDIYTEGQRRDWKVGSD